MSDSSLKFREDALSRLTVVLARPAFAGNVGAVARVMANFGVKRGYLVAPRCDINSVEARQYATGSSAVTLATMNVVKSLRDSLISSNTVIAVTRRTGQMRKPSLSLSDVASRLASGNVTLVFGPEETGLSDDDVHACTDILTLNVSDEMQSLNLSHAVAVVLSRVFDSLSSDGVVTSSNVISASEFAALSERLVRELVKLQDSGRLSNGERLARILSQSLARARLDASELSSWHGLLGVLSPGSD